MTERHRESPRLVVVGSSAGGVEALSVLVSNLPRDLAAPVVIAQHLDRRGPSHLIEILSRRTEMTVQAVEDKAHLEAGTIYVIPANRHVAVTDHELRFVTPTEDGPAPSVDRLLSTAADVFGEGLIAVVLTGMGSDGAAGARRVKAAGGTVIVQDPKTARFPSMPASLAPTSVDIEAPLESIGAIVRELAAELPAASEESEAAILRQLLDRLRDRTGIDFSAYKPPTILRRLQRRLVATGNPDLRQYLRYVGAHPRELDKIGASFLIKVTEFFRDAELFDHLREQLVPKLVEEARGHGRELRVWSAGCATGEEAYSLAVLISDALGVELPDWTIRIFATDLDPDAISFARRGIYPASALAHVDPQTLQRHFTQTDGEYEVRKHLRTMTVFGQHDLGARAPFPRIDLVLCRNVLIYFTPELQRRALQLFAFSLRDGGWLALGKAETTSPLAEYFTVDDSRLKLFRRRGERLLVPPAHTAEPRATAPPRPATARTAFGIENQVEAARRRSAGESAEAVLAAVPVGIIVVDASYDIKAINPAARDLLGIHGSALKRDVVHLAERLDSGALRRAIDTAKAGESSDFTATLLRLDGSSEVQTEVEISAHAAPGPPGDEQRVAILIRDVTGERARVRELETGRDAQRGDVDRLARQIDAYRETNQQLLDANRELTTENVDLRGSNEELLVANEEVQATTEEAETLNEELQATNEELETLNEELQATVEELNTTNDDLEARSAELAEAAGRHEVDRRSAELLAARLAGH
ncbi:MAG TPA: chemotaxis protein CheB, partial [Candidatus Limnocylindrales bacterium]